MLLQYFNAAGALELDRSLDVIGLDLVRFEPRSILRSDIRLVTDARRTSSRHQGRHAPAVQRRLELDARPGCGLDVITRFDCERGLRRRTLDVGSTAIPAS